MISCVPQCGLVNVFNRVVLLSVNNHRREFIINVIHKHVKLIMGCGVTDVNSMRGFLACFGRNNSSLLCTYT